MGAQALHRCQLRPGSTMSGQLFASSLALAGFLSAQAEEIGCPSDWYYKSWQSCTASDSPGTRKCKATANSWGCSGDITQLYCEESDKASCADIGASLSPQEPNGFGFMCPSMMLGTAEMVAAA